MKPFISPIFLLGIIGCAETEVVSSRQLGDTTFVHSAESLRDTATLREILQIGVLDGDPDYMFADLANFAVGPSGDVFIAELGGEVRQYDSEGVFVRRVAGKGQGPGEVEYVVGLDVAEDGRLALVDLGNQRISTYSATGEFVRQIQRPPGRPGYGRDAIRWDSAGNLWIAVHAPRIGPDTLSTDGERPIYGRLALDGTVDDTVFLPARAREGCVRRHHSNARGYFEDGRIPHLPFAQWSRARDGSVALGCSADYSFDVTAPDGSTIRVSKSWQPAEMDGAEQGFWSAYLDEVTRERPAYLRLWLTDERAVWAWPGTAGHRRETSVEERERGWPPVVWDYWSPTDGFDVFDTRGRWVGHVRTPHSWASAPYPGNRDPHFLGDTVWAVTVDEFDASYLSKFVIEWPKSR